MAEASTAQLQKWIDGMNAGDAMAREALFAHTAERLRRLAGKMFQDFRRLGPVNDEDDVCQKAVMRLLNALKSEKPATLLAFFKLAATQIRRELLDEVRKRFGPQGSGAHRAPNGCWQRRDGTPAAGPEKSDSTYDPGRLAFWTEFHEQVQELPEKDREVFELLWYQGLSHAEAATLLGVSEATIQRRWFDARYALGERLRDKATARE
jgi:RNA polymerase sigma-70 factor (ECF subfamily)